MNAVSSRETADQIVAVLINAAHEIVRHADIERAASTTCQDVDIVGQEQTDRQKRECDLDDQWIVCGKQ